MEEFTEIHPFDFHELLNAGEPIDLILCDGLAQLMPSGQHYKLTCDAPITTESGKTMQHVVEAARA